MLIFNNFKVRIMGSGCYHCVLFRNVVKSLNATISIQPKIMSHTAVHDLHYKVNLHRLDPMKFHVSIELFPAAKLLNCGPIHLNVFASGKCICTGIKNQEQMEQTLIHLNQSINKDAIYH